MHPDLPIVPTLTCEIGVEGCANLVTQILLTGALVVRPRGGYTAAQKVNKALGQESFRKIREARALLDQIDSPLRAREFDEIQVC